MSSNQGQCNQNDRAEARKQPVRFVMFLASVILASESWTCRVRRILDLL